MGALIVTLPVTIWPAYMFLALEHDVYYLAASARMSLAVNAVSAIFMFAYLLLAQKRGLLASLLPAIVVWIVLAWLTRSIEWSVYAASAVNLVAYSACLVMSRRFREVRAPHVARQWYELPLRTALVCALMGAVLALSHWAGPDATGMLAAYPVSTTSTMLIVHTRIGGRASAAVIANGLWGMIGIALGLLAFSATILPFGKGLALTLTLIVPVAWNASVWLGRHRGARALAPRR